MECFSLQLECSYKQQAHYYNKSNLLMEEPKQNSESLLDEAKKPFNKLTLRLAYVSIVIGILGLIVGAVFYYKSIKEKNISYQIYEPTSLIYDSQNAFSKIKLIEKDSILIAENVYLLTGKIWNSGDLPIEKSDMRKQLSFVLGGAKRILDFKAFYLNDLVEANFKIEKDYDNSLKIDWDYFDPNFGFSFQILYLGNKSSDFKITGNVLGISNLSTLKSDSYKLNSFINKWLIGLGVFLIVFFIYLYKLMRLSVFMSIINKIYPTNEKSYFGGISLKDDKRILKTGVIGLSIVTVFTLVMFILYVYLKYYMLYHK